MNGSLLRTAWFVGLYLAGVGSVAAIGLVVRALLN